MIIAITDSMGKTHELQADHVDVVGSWVLVTSAQTKSTHRFYKPVSIITLIQ